MLGLLCHVIVVNVEQHMLPQLSLSKICGVCEPKRGDMNMRRKLRSFWMLCVTTMVLACFNDASAQGSYKVRDLGTLNNGNLGCAMAVNNQGWTEIMDGVLNPVSNSLFAPLVSGRAVLNIGELKIDLGTLGGTNSWINYGGLNDRGEAVGMAETSVPDPDGEDVCGFGTKLTCSPFLWRNGHMSALPTVGGNNGQAAAINNRGQIAGFAETTVPDSSCSPAAPSKTDSPVIWEDGKAQALPTVVGDPDGQAQGINERGQVVGYSGDCIRAHHAMLWENGTAFPLPGLGIARSNIAYGINDRGQIVGQSRSADGTTFVAVLWQDRVITNLGTLPGDHAAIATGINNRGQVVGSTLDSGLNWSHAFIWQDGVMKDLNTMFPADSNLFATMANKINERGQISGMATVLSGPHAGDIHAFLATPVNASIGKSIADVVPGHPQSNLPANVPNTPLN
jgi:probable HAF family extracellular repeat protein